MSEIKITDVDKALNSRDQFRIEVDGIWHDKIDAVDFVAYLYKIGEVDNYDAEKGVAIIEHTSEAFNHQTQEFTEKYEAESMTFQKVLDKYFMEDQILIGFVKEISLIVDRALAA